MDNFSEMLPLIFRTKKMWGELAKIEVGFKEVQNTCEALFKKGIPPSIRFTIWSDICNIHEISFKGYSDLVQYYEA